MRFSTLLPVFVSAVFHRSAVAEPSPPGLAYLFTANVTVATAINVGLDSYGQRVAIPVIGGTFEGPRLNGTVLDLGADWGWTDKNNPNGTATFHPDARYNLRTSDGVNIYAQAEGIAHTDGTTHLRGKFETGSAEYYWLNDIVAVAILKVNVGYVLIDWWQLTTPTY